MRSLYESLLGRDIKVDEIAVADWVNSHELYRIKIELKDIKMRGYKYDSMNLNINKKDSY